jgi:hypothetical protein
MTQKNPPPSNLFLQLAEQGLSLLSTTPVPTSRQTQDVPACADMENPFNLAWQRLLSVHPCYRAHIKVTTPKSDTCFSLGTWEGVVQIFYWQGH